jgi:hypothetical protein
MSKSSKPPAPGGGWYFVWIELKAGGFPSKALLAHGRACGGYCPPEVVDFLSKLALGEVKRPRGRESFSRFEREVLGDYVRGLLEEAYDKVLERRDAGEHLLGSPMDNAMEETKACLAREGIRYSTETIRDIRLRRRGW